MIKAKINYSNLMPKKSAVSAALVMLSETVKPITVNSYLSVKVAVFSS